MCSIVRKSRLLYNTDMDKYFQEALSNFTMDAACNDAIRHLTDRGFTAEEIEKQLTFPAGLSHIEKIRAARLDELRRLNSPNADDEPVYEFIEERDSYGRKSFRRIAKSPCSNPSGANISTDS